MNFDFSYIFSNFEFLKLILIFFGLLLLLLKTPIKFLAIFLIFSVLYPISFGNFMGINNFYIYEWLPYIILLKIILSKNNIYYYDGKKIFLFSLLLLFFTAIYHYIMNPVFARNIMRNISQNEGLRIYYDLFTNMLIFFLAFFIFKNYKFYNKKLVYSFLLSALIVSVISFFSFFLNFNIPFLYGNYRYLVGRATFSVIQEQVIRYGGFNATANIIACSFFAIKTNENIKKYDLFIILLIFGLAILGGGRASIIGLIYSIFIFFIILRSKKNTPKVIVLFFIMIAFFLVNIFFPQILTNQLNRISNINISENTSGQIRLEIYKDALYYFKNNIVFGKGISPSDPKIDEYNALYAGGHASYAACIAIFGLVGLFFIVTFALYSQILYIKKSKSVNNILFNFLILFLCVLSVEMITGGTGYNNTHLYLLNGIALGLIKRQEYVLK